MKDKDLSPATMGMYHRHLRAAFNRAIKWKMVQENPFSGVQVARISKKERNGKTENMSYREVQKVLKAIDKAGDVQFGNYVRFLLSTGCRRNEILQVKWENIDRENWTITVYAEKPNAGLPFQ